MCSQHGWTVAGCAVVGVADPIAGQTPVAFIEEDRGSGSGSPWTGATAARDERALEARFRSLRDRVAAAVGLHAVPSRFLLVPALPETRTGKYSRRLLRRLLRTAVATTGGHPSVAETESTGDDLSGLRNPECVREIRAVIRRAWPPPPTGSGAGGVVCADVATAAGVDTETDADEARIRHRISEEVERLLGARTAADLPLMAAGIDSSMALRLREALRGWCAEAQAGRRAAPLPVTLILNYPTVRALSHRLRQTVVKATAAHEASARQQR